jgi:hypothetical protein
VARPGLRLALACRADSGCRAVPAPSSESPAPRALGCAPPGSNSTPWPAAEVLAGTEPAARF